MIVARAVGDIAERRRSLLDLDEALAGIESNMSEALARSLPDLSEEDVRALLSRPATRQSRTRQGRSRAALAVP